MRRRGAIQLKTGILTLFKILLISYLPQFLIYCKHCQRRKYYLSGTSPVKGINDRVSEERGKTVIDTPSIKEVGKATIKRGNYFRQCIVNWRQPGQSIGQMSSLRTNSCSQLLIDNRQIKLAPSLLPRRCQALNLNISNLHSRPPLSSSVGHMKEVTFVGKDSSQATRHHQKRL